MDLDDGDSYSYDSFGEPTSKHPKGTSSLVLTPDKPHHCSPISNADKESENDGHDDYGVVTRTDDDDIEYDEEGEPINKTEQHAESDEENERAYFAREMLQDDEDDDDDDKDNKPPPFEDDTSSSEVNHEYASDEEDQPRANKRNALRFIGLEAAARKKVTRKKIIIDYEQEENREARECARFVQRADVRDTIEKAKPGDKAIMLASLSVQREKELSDDEDEDKADIKTKEDEEFENTHIVADDAPIIVEKHATKLKRLQRRLADNQDADIAYSADRTLQLAAQTGNGLLLKSAHSFSTTMTMDPAEHDKNRFDDIGDETVRDTANILLNHFVYEYVNRNNDDPLEVELNTPAGTKELIDDIIKQQQCLSEMARVFGDALEPTQWARISRDLKTWHRGFTPYGLFLVAVMLVRYHNKQPHAGEEKIANFGWLFHSSMYPKSTLYDFVTHNKLSLNAKAYFIADRRPCQQDSGMPNPDLITVSQTHILTFRSLLRVWIVLNAMPRAVAIALQDEEMSPHKHTDFKACKKILVKNNDIKAFCADVASGLITIKQLYANYKVF